MSPDEGNRLAIIIAMDDRTCSVIWDDGREACWSKNYVNFFFKIVAE